MKPSEFTYHRPPNVGAALALLAAYAPIGGRILAGGQSLVPMMAYRMAQPSHLIDITAITELRGMAIWGDTLIINAGTRHAAFNRPVCAGPLGAMLSFVSRHIAHAPIRNRGTFGGSLANADPASEWCTLMITLGGAACVQNLAGSRLVAATDFFTGIMSTALAEDEILTAAHLPMLDGYAWGFYEISRRAGDYAMAMCLVAYRLEGGVMRDVHIGIGGAEAVPRRMPSAEAALTRRAPSAQCFAAAADAAADLLDPMTDHNVTAGFRRDLVRAAVGRALARSVG